MRRWTLALGTVCALAAAPGQASPRSCIQAHETALSLQSKAKLTEAKSKLEECAADSCPDVVRNECARLVAEVEANIPTVVLGAVDATGSDVAEATVALDGKAVVNPVRGTAVHVDPGVHTVRFTTSAGDSAEKQFIARIGEKNRQVVVQFPPRVAQAKQPNHDAGTKDHAPRVAAYVLAGVATVALGAFSYFAITGKRAENRVDVCAPNCSDSEYESMRNKYLFADIGLGVAVLSSGAAAYLFLADSGPDGPPREAASRVAPAGWQLSLSGRF